MLFLTNSRMNLLILFLQTALPIFLVTVMPIRGNNESDVPQSIIKCGAVDFLAETEREIKSARRLSRPILAKVGMGNRLSVISSQ